MHSGFFPDISISGAILHVQFKFHIRLSEMIQKGMVMRNPQLWLSWLDKNPKTKSMETLNKSLEDEVFKAELLKEVKSLKDKKLRKAWEKRLK